MTKSLHVPDYQLSSWISIRICIRVGIENLNIRFEFIFRLSFPKGQFSKEGQNVYNSKFGSMVVWWFSNGDADFLRGLGKILHCQYVLWLVLGFAARVAHFFIGSVE